LLQHALWQFLPCFEAETSLQHKLSENKVLHYIELMQLNITDMGFGKEICIITHVVFTIFLQVSRYIIKLLILLNKLYISVTGGQSNLAKAASNAPHTLHMQDSVAVAVPESQARSS